MSVRGVGMAKPMGRNESLYPGPFSDSIEYAPGDGEDHAPLPVKTGGVGACIVSPLGQRIPPGIS